MLFQYSVYCCSYALILFSFSFFNIILLYFTSLILFCTYTASCHYYHTYTTTTTHTQIKIIIKYSFEELFCSYLESPHLHVVIMLFWLLFLLLQELTMVSYSLHLSTQRCSRQGGVHAYQTHTSRVQVVMQYFLQLYKEIHT